MLTGFNVGGHGRWLSLTKKKKTSQISNMSCCSTAKYIRVHKYQTAQGEQSYHYVGNMRQDKALQNEKEQS